MVKLAAPNAGRFTGRATFKLKSKGKHKVVYGKGSVSLSGAGTVTLKLGPSGSAKHELALLQKVLVALKLTFSPTGGSQLSHTLHIKVKRRHGRFS